MELDRPLEVLISGGGDGAIQDFLLLATGVSSIVELAAAVGLSTYPSPGSKPELAEFEREALSFEESCWRELCWCGPDGVDAAKEQRICEDLDRFYRAWLETRVPLGRVPRNPHVRCTLVRRTAHHSLCHPLNRLLAIPGERDLQPRVLEGDLLDLPIKAEDFDLTIIRHGIEPGGRDPGPRVRRQALPFHA